MYGKRFFKDEFGVENRVLWLPDVFGYSAALPQILKKSGVDWFVTSKISWNDTNTMPHDNFIWQGIDGTEIFSSFIQGQKYTPTPDRRTTYVGNNDSNFITRHNTNRGRIMPTPATPTTISQYCQDRNLRESVISPPPITSTIKRHDKNQVTPTPLPLINDWTDGAIPPVFVNQITPIVIKP
jgi:hypothetical protein